MDLKKSYQKHLYIFLGVHLVVFLTLVMDFNSLLNFSLTDGIKVLAFSMASLILFVLNRLIPSPAKEILVFWRLQERLPGHQAFSKYALNDERIDLHYLKAKHPELEKTGFNENKLWYKIYQTHKNNPSVFDAHKNYLMARDMTMLVVVIFWVVAIMLFDSTLIGFLILEYLIFVVVCRNYAIKFVQNVLAVESASPLLKV